MIVGTVSVAAAPTANDTMCLACACPILPGQDVTSLRGTRKHVHTQYHHTRWEDCQDALRAGERVIWPSYRTSPGGF